MAHSNLFRSAKDKLERAKEHITDLEAAITTFKEAHPYTVIIEDDVHSGFTMAQVKSNRELPRRIPFALGDAAHNLRSALDHAVWELFGRDGGKQNRHTTFPTALEWNGYKGLCKGKETPRDDTKEFLLSLEAYKGGRGDILWRLAHLDIIDKHRAVAIAGRAVTVPKLIQLSPEGKIAAFTAVWSFSSPHSGFGNIGVRTLPGHTVKFDNNSQPAFDVVFVEPDLGPFQPVIPFILHMSDAVAQTIGQFEMFVSSRA